VKGVRIAVFLDRDGTINEEVEFLRRPEELQLIPGAAGAVRMLNERGLLTCVISNQSGVARGLFSERDLDPIHDALRAMLARENARVDRIYYCPHHPTEGQPPYRIDCACRKPSPGMLHRGEHELGIDLHRSFVVGDRIVDIQAGKAVGAVTLLVLTGYGTASACECAAAGVTPDAIVPSLREAADVIIHMLDGDPTYHA
jgi:D-glycero-D-manno-heptose 1,7-bisphosphate phosphatase